MTAPATTPGNKQLNQCVWTLSVGIGLLVFNTILSAAVAFQVEDWQMAIKFLGIQFSLLSLGVLLVTIAAVLYFAGKQAPLAADTGTVPTPAETTGA